MNAAKWNQSIEDYTSSFPLWWIAFLIVGSIGGCA